jgi:hypothetical protein
MMRTVALVALLISVAVSGQWSWTALAPLPMPTANHALCAAEVNGSWNVYVFGGITTGLTNADIHRNAYRYEVASDTWSPLPDVPDTLGKIAASASVVGDTAYVIGGYHVFNGAPFELSSNRVHRLNLVTNTWMADGAPVPVAIDDQVQVVWRDSLIYVVTGWSNTTNVANVQVYDPAHNSWSVATSVPNNNQYKAFGAGGVLIGDTIIYHGGASTAGNFPAQDRVRMGVIDAASPMTIEWLPAVTGGQGARYRAGPAVVDGRPTWIGGSAISYNYDALAYAGGAVVPPATAIQQWNGTTMTTAGATPTNVMDQRAIAAISGNELIVAGGIGLQRVVLDSVWSVSTAPTHIAEPAHANASLHPNPAAAMVTAHWPASTGPLEWVLRDAQGRAVASGRGHGPTVTILFGDRPAGLYTVHLSTEHRTWTGRLVKTDE